MPPLYKITIGKEYKYIKDDAALEEFRKQHIGKKYECKSDWVKVSQITGRVYEVYFEEI